MPNRGFGTEDITDSFSLLNTADSDELIIGVDFGTTFSGIAYVITGSKKPDIISILDWPGNKGRTASKVPTVLSYNGADGKTVSWGYELEQTSTDKIEAIKLLLDPEQEKPSFFPHSTTKAELERLEKSPIEVATDYLSALYTHALTRIQSTWPANYLEVVQKKFVLTVPAVWSDKAKELTERAATTAGISPITLIKEPEAAALYTLHYLKDKALKVGDAFVICDAGGGTVDLISYEITKLGSLELRELVPGKGSLAGSLVINKRFEQFIEDIVGEDDFVILRKHKGYQHAMKQFDVSVKPAFTSSDDEFFINFPRAGLKDDYANNICDNCLSLTGEDVQGIFAPVIEEIQKLVDEQVSLVKLKRMTEENPKAKDIKAIFLVGGFGSSLYLKDCLQQAHPDIQVIQPNDAWSAIVKGAVMSQLPEEAVITSSIATKHYGVSCYNFYEENEDAGEKKIWNKYEHINQVSKMTWYINIGDNLRRERKITVPVYRTLPADFTGNDLVFEDSLTESPSVKPPKYPRKGLTRTNCVLKADLRSVDRSEFKAKTSPSGVGYVEVWYKLGVKIKPANMEFSLEINGKEMGKVEANYS